MPKKMSALSILSALAQLAQLAPSANRKLIRSNFVTFRHISSHVNHSFCDQKQLRPPLLGEA